MIGWSFGLVGLAVLEFALLLVEFAFALDAAGAVLGAGGLAPRHGQPAGVCPGYL